MELEEEILKKLDSFPSIFSTFDFVQTIEKERKEKILSKVIRERDTDGYDSVFEDTNALNFISYMSFAVGIFEDAVKYNNMALQQSEYNINAIVSKARYHLHKSEYADSREQCDLLDTLKNNELEMLHAKAELAIVCSRLGMEMCKKAEHLFKEALKEGEDTNMISQYETCVLKFGLTLILRRQLNFSNIHAENIGSFGEEANICNHLLGLFIDIIKTQGEKLDRHKARSYMQIGETLNLIVIQPTPVGISEQIMADLPGEDIKSKIRHCYETGYDLQRNDVFVIERFAKYCRLIGDVDRSIDLCKSSLCIRETSIGHHYLALALKKKLRFDNANTYLCKKTQQIFKKPQHIQLRMEMNTNQTCQDQQGTNIGPQETTNLPYYSYYDEDERPFVDAYDERNTSGERTSFTKPTDEWQKVRTRKSKKRQCRESNMQNETSDKQLNDRPGRGNCSRSSNNIDQDGTSKTGWNNLNESNMITNEEEKYTQGKSRWVTEPIECSKHRSREEKAKHFLSQMIKSPMKQEHLSKDSIGNILYHLDKAMELSENMPAKYDKALTLRSADQHEEALDIFKSMFRNKGCSLLNLANAYEQSAFCLKDLIETDIKTDLSGVDKMKIDRKEYLLKSIEITCNLIAKQPLLKNCWAAFPTLKSLLEENPRSKSNIRELGMLHRKVKDYNESIELFEKLIEMETNAIDKASAHMDVVRDCLKAEKYDEAILHLDMVQCLSDCDTIIDENLYFEAHIKGGLESYFKGEEEMACLRLKNALNYKRGSTTQELLQDQLGRQEQYDLFEQEWFDVFILCDPKSETTGRHICCVLRKLGLKVTLNDDAAAPGSLYMNCLTKDIERSTHGIVILGNDMDDVRHIQIFTDIMKNVQKNHKYGNIVVVMENEHVHVDLMFTGFTSITYAQGLTEPILEEHKHWLNKLLGILATGTTLLA